MHTMDMDTGSLWHHAKFMSLWMAFTLSEFGSSLTTIALPLTAITLKATPIQMSVLTVAATLPYVLVAPLAGVMVDRMQRPWIMIAADRFRAVIVLIIPMASLTGRLRIEYLWLVTFGITVGSVLFDIAYGSYLPVLVGRARLLNANAMISASQSLAAAAGPGVVGVLIQLLGAPGVLIANSVTYLISGILIGSAHKTELHVPAINSPARSIRVEIWQGIALLTHHPLLRVLTLRLAAWHFIVGGMQATFMLYIIKELQLGPGTVGLLYSLIGVGTLLGSAIAGSLTRRLGVGRVIIFSNVTAAAAAGLIPLASGSALRAGSLVAVALVTYGVCLILYQINNVSLRQALTPELMLGRMSAATRILTFGTNAIGAIASGILAEAAGLRATLTGIACLAIALAAKGLISSRVRLITSLPDSRTCAGGRSARD